MELWQMDVVGRFLFADGRRAKGADRGGRGVAKN